MEAGHVEDLALPSLWDRWSDSRSGSALRRERYTVAVAPEVLLVFKKKPKK